jgi:membrane fusion protein, multidrug efflux system
VVAADNKIAPRPVTLGAIFNGLRVIRAGLTIDDKVVIVGLANPMVRPGVVVTPQPGEIKPATN